MYPPRHVSYEVIRLLYFDVGVPCLAYFVPFSVDVIRVWSIYVACLSNRSSSLASFGSYLIISGLNPMFRHLWFVRRCLRVRYACSEWTALFVPCVLCCRSLKLRREIQAGRQGDWDIAQGHKVRVATPCVQQWHSSFSVVTSHTGISTDRLPALDTCVLCCAVSRLLSVEKVCPAYFGTHPGRLLALCRSTPHVIFTAW
jgi:hypothetical protein